MRYITRPSNERTIVAERIQPITRKRTIADPLLISPGEVPYTLLSGSPAGNLIEAIDHLRENESKLSRFITMRRLALAAISFIPSAIFTAEQASCTDVMKPKTIAIEVGAAMILGIVLCRLRLAPMLKPFNNNKNDLLSLLENDGIGQVQNQLRQCSEQADKQRKEGFNQLFGCDVSVALLAITILMIHAKWSEHCSHHRIKLFAELDEVTMIAVLIALIAMHLYLRHSMSKLTTKKNIQQALIIDSLSSPILNQT